VYKRQGEDAQTFTQQQVESMIQSRLKNTHEKLTTTQAELSTKVETEQKLVGQLEKMREVKGLSEQEKQSLTEQINDLQSSLQTKEQSQAGEIKRLTKTYEEKLEASSSAAKQYQSRFESTMVNNSLLEAATQEGALNPQQIQAMYSGNVKLIQQRDEDGNLLEQFVPVMTFNGLDKHKKVVNIEKPVSEALKKIREDGLNANLFKGHQVGGSGAPTTPRDANGEPVLSKNPPRKADYSSTDQWYSALKKWKELQKKG
jgi:hypothetical protein